IFGANIVLTPSNLGMQGSIDKAKEIVKSDEKAILLDQFSNIYNPDIHQITTANEILNDMDNNIDIFVTSVGTGGTLTGTAKVLKEKLPNIKIVAVEPYNSAVLSGEKANPHKIQGIGAGFIPSILDTNIYNDIIKVKDEEAIEISKKLAKKEGLLVGISSGANIYAALKLAKENQNKKIVTILCDDAQRYLSTELFD
ncbi:MAG: pyridoxal-phosphate dependent enzyme, partial [Campylobacterota bacterium]|nr:pyridoxal-phosphate dependent enzyme [Campylobacterota bacterium]